MIGPPEFDLSPEAIAQLVALGFDPTDPALLQEQLVHGLADNLELFARVEHQAPLAASALWTAPAAAWDQRRSVVSTMTAPLIGLVLGGNRSGKSVGLKQLTVAQLLGGDHPIVRAWCDLNRLPQDVIPHGPGICFAVAPSSADSIKYHRSDIDRLLGPIGKTWYNKNSKGEAWLYVEVPGYTRRAELWFKSVDQKRRGFQGISARWIWFDEEPEGETGKEVVDECKLRVADQSGRIGISMYPGDGITWVHDDFIRDRKDDARVAELDTLDNPHLPRHTFEALYRGMDEDELARRRYGKFRARTGAIFPDFQPGTGDRWGPGHMVDPFDIPPDWPRYRAADFGLKNPTCVLWGALGDDDTLYIYREHYGAGPTYQEHAARVVELERGESILCGWGDPSGSGEGEAFNAFAEAGIVFTLARRGVRDGINEVRDRLRLHADNRPRLKIFRTCANLLWEFPAYHWDPNRKDEAPVKVNDHAMDAVRYLAMGLQSLTGY